MRNSQVLYQATQEQFFSDVQAGRILEKMEFEAQNQQLAPSESEKKSWRNNAPAIKELLEKSKVRGAYVVFEYLLPRSTKRVDCMLFGEDAKGAKNVLHIELKQWSNETVHDTQTAANFEIKEDELQALTGGELRVVAHPSQQARGYNGYLSDFLEVIQSGEVKIRGCSYCYNYLRHLPGGESTLYASQFRKLQEECRTYAKDETSLLAEEISWLFDGGNGQTVFETVMNSDIRQSKKLLDSVGNMFTEGMPKEFHLLEDQIPARNEILDKARKLVNQTKKQIIIVHGGPGTGKTVIALDVLSELARSCYTSTNGKRHRYNVHYATKSASLIGAITRNMPPGHPVRNVITNLQEFNPRLCSPGEIDVLLVDEAHRIEDYFSEGKGKFRQKVRNVSQIDGLIMAARVLVVFIDDKQAIRKNEIGNTGMVREAASRNGADISEVTLSSQFRCNGSDNYLDWIDQVLYNRPVTVRVDRDEYALRFFDSPDEMYNQLLLHQKEGYSARLTAGFCWPWSDHLDPVTGSLVRDVVIDDFAMPWETHYDIKGNPPTGYVRYYEWAYVPNGINQIGCIYTAQGFEFDYCGVIIANDLIYKSSDDSLVTNASACQDPTLKNKQTGKVYPGYDEYVRNIYRVLLSRGIKGTYVYCCDSNVRDYLKRKLSINK